MRKEDEQNHSEVSNEQLAIIRLRMANMELIKMPNIGPVLERLLIAAGIETPEQLVNTGSKEAFLRIRTIDSGACLHMLYALEGAVRNIRKCNLSLEEKKELNNFFKGLK